MPSNAQYKIMHVNNERGFFYKIYAGNNLWRNYLYGNSKMFIKFIFLN